MQECFNSIPTCCFLIEVFHCGSGNQNNHPGNVENEIPQPETKAYINLPEENNLRTCFIETIDKIKNEYTIGVVRKINGTEKYERYLVPFTPKRIFEYENRSVEKMALLIKYR